MSAIHSQGQKEASAACYDSSSSVCLVRTFLSRLSCRRHHRTKKKMQETKIGEKGKKGKGKRRRKKKEKLADPNAIQKLRAPEIILRPCKKGVLLISDRRCSQTPQPRSTPNTHDFALEILVPSRRFTFCPPPPRRQMVLAKCL